MLIQLIKPVNHSQILSLLIINGPIIAKVTIAPHFLLLVTKLPKSHIPVPVKNITRISIHHAGSVFHTIIPTPARLTAAIAPAAIGLYLGLMDIYPIIATLVIGFAVTLYFIRRWLVEHKPQPDATLAEWLKSTNEAVRESSRQFNDRLDNAAKVISDVQKHLGEMSEVGRNLKSLQDFLSSPKLRGGLGEEIMSQMIGQTFPKNAFHLQYQFKSGSKVDAVLKTDAGLLCIDSKFPLENFSRLARGEAGAKKDFIFDVKKHIVDISKKYILPQEGTMDFALMYIPSESVYYEVVNISELSSFARASRVYPVSPSTFYAHLQVLLQSLQGKELATKSRQVFQLLRAIQKDYEQTQDSLSTLGRHLTNAHNQMGNVTSSFGLLGQKLHQTNYLSGPGPES